MKEQDPSNISWKQMFYFTRNGRPQNADLMYAFFLGLGIMFLNFIFGNRVTILIENLLPDASRGLKNCLGIAIPALLCVLAAWLLFRLIRKKKIVLWAYIFSLVTALIFVAAMVFTYDRETAGELFIPFASIFVIPAAAGMLTVSLLYRRWCKLNPDPVREEAAELLKQEKRSPLK